jgi:hypothetical protein
MNADVALLFAAWPVVMIVVFNAFLWLDLREFDA